MPNWEPLKGCQELAISAPVDEVLFHGTRGGGKSEAQIARFVIEVGKGYGAHWRGIIFDRKYKSLGDLVGKSHQMIPIACPKAEWKEGKFKWVFPGGEELLFRHIARVEEYRDYHGQEFPFVGWNELTSYASSEIYDLISSCVRTSFIAPADGSLAPLPMCIFSTTNPLGAGHAWVKKKFIDGGGDCTIQDEHTEVFNPRTQRREDLVKTKVAIFSSYKENIFLDPRYVATLEKITCPNKRAAWLEGDWSVTAGGAVDDLFDAQYHVKPRFKVPSNWELSRGFDNGSTQPFAVVFGAVANGEEVKLPDGSIFAPPAGSLILYDWIYGGERDAQGKIDYSTNMGIKAPIRDVAKMIVESEQKAVNDDWVTTRPSFGVADNAIFNTNDTEFGSLSEVMDTEGVYWSRSDKSAGSRIRGLELIRQMLDNALTGEGAGLYVMDNVEPFFETVVTIPRCTKNPEDVDTTAVDHFYDALRYLCTAKVNTPSDSLDVSFDW